MLKRQWFILLCLTLVSCYQSQTSKDKEPHDITKHLDSVVTTPSQTIISQKITLTVDSTYPCQLSNPDTSVYDIILNDRQSSIRQVGDKFSPIEDDIDLPHEDFCTQDREQTLTLFFHYGGVRNEFSEFQVKKYSNSDSAIKLSATIFQTNNGITLGLSKSEVISILGDCFKKVSNSKTKEIIKYRIDDFEHSTFLQRFNYPSYYAEYEFRNDKLVRYRFGFEYP
ncbi:MAG TPA: hypothetical protein P5228_10710 [Bacteroidales bacterium]|nr:hypothetical protein [Bacteroidales bacterium]HRZ49094.1 hypothetical protein [Bacteroidales bacterium]